jgi:hypothetical protein
MAALPSGLGPFQVSFPDSADHGHCTESKGSVGLGNPHAPLSACVSITAFFPQAVKHIEDCAVACKPVTLFGVAALSSIARGLTVLDKK